GLTYGAYGTSGLSTSYVFLASAATLIVVFLLYERRADCPLIYQKVFRIREVSGGLFALLLNVMTWTGVLLLLSLQFQLVENLSPLQAGLRILPFEIAFLAVGPLSGRLADKYGQSQFTVTGLVLTSIALFLFSTTNASTPYLVLSIFMVLLGVGTGLFVAPNLRAVMSSVPPERRGIGSALFTLFLNIGLTVSLNLAVLVMSLTAPYNLITQIITAANPQAIPAGGIALFLSSLKNTYLVFAVVNTLAIIPATIGGRIKKVQTSAPIAEG
ncbi:MAG TPA: MFS transporter, partial [Candidatus Acidoferrum sp.]|nr:MFS transporter [Candidatus Acidoferrum sp.]